MRWLMQAVVPSTNFGPCYPQRQTWYSILFRCSTSRPSLFALIRNYIMFDSKKFLSSISSGFSFDRLTGIGVSITRCIKVHQRHSQAPQGSYVFCVWSINMCINVWSIVWEKCWSAGKRIAFFHFCKSTKQAEQTEHAYSLAAFVLKHWLFVRSRNSAHQVQQWPPRTGQFLPRLDWTLIWYVSLSSDPK